MVNEELSLMAIDAKRVAAFNPIAEFARGQTNIT
jgi:hypothetical protein